MSTYSLSHLADSTLLRDLAALVTRDRTTTAHLLAHLAEVDARKLYLPAAYPSMYAYCIGELHLSEDGASKRIQAARVARRFPAIFEAVAEGRLHLSAVVLLAPYLTEHTADELLAAATHKTKSEIELLVAQRFPRPDVLAWVEAIPTTEQHAPGHVEGGPPLVPEPVGEEPRHAPAHAGAPLLGQHAPGHVQPVFASGHAGDRARVKPLGSHSFAVQFTLSRNGHDQLRYAQALLGHQIPSGDLAQVFERALDALVGQLERRKFAATARPRPGQRRSPAPGRHIPAHVRRAVWERDGGQCTFVGETGRRCSAHTRLEFDHVLEVARGGEATVVNLRLRCRAHNQYQAERTFGAEFMRHRRERGRKTARARATTTARAGAGAQAEAAASERAQELDVAPWLRQLGFRVDEIRRAVALCEGIPDASLEDRVRLAISSLARGGQRRERVVPPGPTAAPYPLRFRSGAETFRDRRVPRPRTPSRPRFLRSRART